jgi:hypothetical protein
MEMNGGVRHRVFVGETYSHASGVPAFFPMTRFTKDIPRCKGKTLGVARKSSAEFPPQNPVFFAQLR